MLADTVDQGGTTDFAATFGAFSASLEFADLPVAVASAVKVNLLDTLSCAIAGFNAPGIGEVLALVKSWGGAPQAAILCSDIRVPAHHAAWVNGMMAHARDFDDTHDGAVLHAGVSVIPAALAAAELSPAATGADLLAGIAAGLELICRLGVATTIGIVESGFIYTSLFGYFGATAAAARLLRLDARQTTNALGIAYSQAAGTHQVTRDGAMTKRMQPGFAAKAALLSVQLAQREIRGAQNSFEGIDGLFRTYLGSRYDPVILRSALGEHYEMTMLSYKAYPCCRFNHTAIDAALAISNEPGFNPAAIDRIVAGVNRQAYEAVCMPIAIRQSPTTIVQAQFSIPYTVACMLLDGEVTLRHFTDEALAREDLRALARKVVCEVNEGIEQAWSRSISPTALVVQSGSHQFECQVDYPRGHRMAPMTPCDVNRKMADCVITSGLDWLGGVQPRLRETVDAMEHTAVPTLLRLFLPHAARQ